MCSLPPGTCSGRSRGLKPQSICSCAGDYGQYLITCGFVLGPNGLTTACMAAGLTSPAHCMGYCNAAASSRSPAAHEHHQVGMSAAASSCMTRDVLVASHNLCLVQGHWLMQDTDLSAGRHVHCTSQAFAVRNAHAQQCCCRCLLGTHATANSIQAGCHAYALSALGSTRLAAARELHCLCSLLCMQRQGHREQSW